MSGTPGTVTGPNLPCGPEMRSDAGGAFHPREDAAAGTRTHRSYLQLAAAPGAVPYARRHTRQTLAAWQVGGIAEDIELVLSELMTNAVRATLEMPLAAQVALYLALDHGRLTLLIWDACPELPVPRAHDDDAAGGRGLEIVQALSDRWGSCIPDQGGKVVWAWFDLAPPPKELDHGGNT